MPIMEISIVPLGTKSPSVSHYVADCLKLLDKEEGIKYQLTAMGTIIEADSVKALLLLAEKMHTSVLDKDVYRVVTTIKIDDRRDKQLSIEGKIQSVQAKQ